MNILQLSANGAVLILMVWLLRFLLKNHLPRTVFSTLWLVSAIRLLLPVRLESPVSIWRVASRSASPIVPMMGQYAAEYTSARAVQNKTEMESFLAEGFSWVTVIWLVGAVFMAAYFAVGYVRGLRRFQRAVPIDRASFKADFSKSWERRVQLRMTHEEVAPLTYGILRPVILLPAYVVEKQESLFYIFLHEFTHIRRLDCLSKLLLTAALCLHWWNPLIWLMARLANTDMEVACDEAVLQRLGEGLRKHYATMLVELESQRVSASPLYSCFGKNATKERIHAIMKSKQMTRFSLIVSAILAVVTISVFATQAPLQNVSAENTVVQIVSLPEEKSGQSEVIEGNGVNVWGKGNDDQSLPEQEQPVDTSWSSPLATGLSPTATFGMRVHPVFGTETFHDGVDLAAETGTPIFAIKGGVVARAGFDESMGNYLEIDHGNGYLSRYQHCKELLVWEGDTVEQGSVVAYVGNSGWATGSHLHLSVSFDESFVDPIKLFG